MTTTTCQHHGPFTDGTLPCLRDEHEGNGHRYASDSGSDLDAEAGARDE